MAYRRKVIRSVLLARLNAVADGFEDPDVIVPDTDEPAWKNYMGRPTRNYEREKMGDIWRAQTEIREGR